MAVQSSASAAAPPNARASVVAADLGVHGGVSETINILLIDIV